MMNESKKKDGREQREVQEVDVKTVKAQYKKPAIEVIDEGLLGLAEYRC